MEGFKMVTGVKLIKSVLLWDLQYDCIELHFLRIPFLVYNQPFISTGSTSCPQIKATIDQKIFRKLKKKKQGIFHVLTTIIWFYFWY